MFYVLRFNAALAAMNIPPNVFPSEARGRAQDWGKRLGLTPQEAAVILVAEVFGINYPANACVPLAVEVWLRERKIFENKPEVQEALMALHLY